MEVFLRRISLLFSAGAVGGLVSSAVFWLLGRFGITQMIGVHLAPKLTPAWLYPRLVWGGIWAALFLIPILKNATVKRGLLFSLAPSAALLFVWFPHQAYKGYLGLELGGLTPVLILVLNAVWGITAAAWLSVLGEE